MTETPLDRAHVAMAANPDDDVARLRFYEHLADAELFMLLDGDPDGDEVAPSIYEVEGATYALVFDTEERLSQFTGRVVPYAGLPGRGLAGMLQGQGIGLALNPDVAPSAMLIPSDAVDWLVETLDHAPEEAEASLQEIRHPQRLPRNVVEAIDRKLALAAGMAQCAYLAEAVYADQSLGHILAFIDAPEAAQQALANAAGEALRFSGIEAGVMDVLFAGSSDPLTAHLEKVALRFDLPQPAERPQPAAPGSDPDKPPKLR